MRQNINKMENARVSDYMTYDVISVDVSRTVQDVIDLIRTTHHDGFPVTREGKIAGYITARDIIGELPATRIDKKMTRHVITAAPDTTVTEVARRIFRTGIQKLPIIDDEQNVLGIISNIDVIRSQIERVTPEKVYNFQQSLKTLYDVDSTVKREFVDVSAVHPTQQSVNQEELDGRIYELERKFAEPVIVVASGNRMILVDGHHRAVAANKLKMKKLDAYVITLARDVELGLEKTARSMGIITLDDVRIDKTPEHSLVAATHPGLISTEKKIVSEYMTREVITLDATQTVKDVIETIRKTHHDGFPVLLRRKGVGLISARDIIGAKSTDGIAPLMQPMVLKSSPTDSMTEVARKMFRFCVQKLPVVSTSGECIGLITNADVIRSQIERVTPDKVYKYINTLKNLYHLDPHLTRGEVDIHKLIPTQDKIYSDELDARTYEIERGLAEPLIVVQRKENLILVDGHHRAVAANRMHLTMLDAYVISIDSDDEIGLEKTSRQMRLWNLDKIKILDESKHSVVG